jgi:hypothetical protein
VDVDVRVRIILPISDWDRSIRHWTGAVRLDEGVENSFSHKSYDVRAKAGEMICLNLRHTRSFINEVITSLLIVTSTQHDRCARETTGAGE